MDVNPVFTIVIPTVLLALCGCTCFLRAIQSRRRHIAYLKQQVRQQEQQEQQTQQTQQEHHTIPIGIPVAMPVPVYIQNIQNTQSPYMPPPITCTPTPPTYPLTYAGNGKATICPPPPQT